MLKFIFKILQIFTLILGTNFNCWAVERVCLLEPTPPDLYSSFCPEILTGGVSAARRAPLPSETMLEIMPIKDQRTLGTCTSFAVGGIVEYIYRSRKLSVSVAELTVLANTHLPEGTCESSKGLSLGNVLRIAFDMGCVKEKRLPYSDYLTYVAHHNRARSRKDTTICLLDTTKSPLDNYNGTMAAIRSGLYLTGNRREDVTDYRIGVPIVIRSRPDGRDPIRAIKEALIRGNPVAAAVPVFPGEDWDKTGLIEMRPEGATPRGLHAVVLWGYADKGSKSPKFPKFEGTSGILWFRNSWGSAWGQGGHGYMPFEYILNYAIELVEVRAA